MPKTKISEFSATPGNNTDIDGINIAEGCAPSGINDAIRELMSQLKDFQAGTAGDSFNGPVGTSTAAAGAFTTLSASSSVTLSGGTANGVAYLNGSKVLTTGSALTFDGTNLLVGANSVLNTVSNYRTIQLTGTSGAIFDLGQTATAYGRVSADSTGLNLEGLGNVVTTFRVNNSEQMRLTPTGLGIGTSSPGSYGKLSVNGHIIVPDGSGIVFNTAFGNAPTTLITGSQASNYLRFYTNNALQATLDASGNLLVGTTDNSITSGPGVKIAPNIGAAVVSTLSTNSNSCSHVYSTGAGAYRFYVGWGGTVYATSTSISAISDATLKENVRDLETGLTEVMALRPRRFDWKNGDAQNVAGFVAQEVEQVLPELVTDYQYSEGVTKKSLKMGDILPTLVNAIQEQQAIINQLKARLDAANL